MAHKADIFPSTDLEHLEARLRKTEEMFRFMIEGTAASTGMEFFRAMTRSMCAALGFRYALVGRLAPNQDNTIETLTVWDGEIFGKNLLYDLDGSPCENVVGRKICVYPEKIQDLFPRDPLLVEMNAESYIGAPLFDSSGRPLGVLAVLDVNPISEEKISLATALIEAFAGRTAAEYERMMAERRLKEGEELLAAILESTADGILVVNRDGKAIHANRRFAEMWRIPNAALATRNDSKLIAFVLDQLADPQAFVEKVERLYASFETGMDILDFKDGRHFERFSCPLIFDGALAGRIWSFRDITERWNAEKELELHRERLEELVEKRTEELTKAQRRVVASERLAVLGQFSGGIAHEIRNPLSVIYNSAYFLKRKIGDGDERVAYHLDEIRNQVNRTTEIIDSILKLTRMEPPRMDRIDLLEVVRVGASDVKLPAGIDLEWQGAGGPAICMGDRSQLAMACKNLVKNAVQALNGSGKIQLAVAAVENNGRPFAELRVKDNGPGIEPEILEKIFDPMFTTKSFGIGFGLSIVRMIVEKHGGSIVVNTRPGEGAEFVMQIPA